MYATPHMRIYLPMDSDGTLYVCMRSISIRTPTSISTTYSCMFACEQYTHTYRQIHQQTAARSFLGICLRTHFGCSAGTPRPRRRFGGFAMAEVEPKPKSWLLQGSSTSKMLRVYGRVDTLTTMAQVSPGMVITTVMMVVVRVRVRVRVRRR